MKQQKEIFRKVALDRLSSPEQLDTLVQVTSPTNWYALGMIFALIGIATIWAWEGRIEERVRGKGILIRSRGVVDVVTVSGGQVAEIVVAPGEVVRQGQVVARISQPETLKEINNVKAELEEKHAQHKDLEDFLAKDKEFQLDTMSAQSEALEIQKKYVDTSVNNLDDQTVWFKGQLTKLQKLLDEGIILSEQVQRARTTLNETTQRADSQRSRRDDIAVLEQDIRVKKHTLENEARRKQLESQYEINRIQRRIDFLEAQLAANSRVICKYTGRVIELKSAPGDMLSPGSPALSIELLDEKLEAVIYVPSTEGKKIKPGMEIYISPTTVRKEEFGSILGLVTYVSDYPATMKGMVQVVGNEQLVQSLIESQKGSPFAVIADLIPDKGSPSGYKWSSSTGPSTQIQSGTLCEGAITTEAKRPVDLALPIFKRKLGL